MENIDIEIEDEGPGEDEASWMTTFADLMSLLLTFFVLLLSFAEMDIIKFRDALGSVQSAFGYADSMQGLNPTRSASIIENTYDRKDTLMEPPLELKFKQIVTKSAQAVEMNENEEILDSIRESIEKNHLEELADTAVTGRGVVVRVKGNLFFDSGSDVLKKEAHPLLEDIIAMIEKHPYNVAIEGHTDNTPINTARFRSNWELSTARAISTLRYILDTGRVDSGRLGASGYADTRPIAPNDSPEGQQKNRRVEFNFYKE